MAGPWNIDIAGQFGQPGGPPGVAGSPGPGYLATSATNFTIGTGSMTFVTQAGLAYTIGARARVSSHADPTQWMEGLVTAYDGVSQLTINVDLNNQIVNANSTASPTLVSGAGRLTYVSSTALKFAPYNGNYIKINGIYYQIPTAGIAGLATTGVYVNGVSGQNLAASTLYYVYCFNLGGTLTADFSTTAYANSTSGANAGTFIKSGDDSRSLIGLVYIPPTIGFYDSLTQRLVRSWFNAPTVVGNPGDTSGSFANTSYVPLGPGNVQWVQFAGEVVTMATAGAGALNGSSVTCWIQLYVDGAAYGQGSVAFYPSYVWMPFSITISDTLSEGFHYMQPYGQVNGGTQSIGLRTTVRLSR